MNPFTEEGRPLTLAEAIELLLLIACSWGLVIGLGMIISWLF